jgi:hypothetical protein
MAGRPRVWRAVENVKAQLDRVRFLSLEDPAWLETIHRQHETIVERVLEARRPAVDPAGRPRRLTSRSARWPSGTGRSAPSTTCPSRWAMMRS